VDRRALDRVEGDLLDQRLELFGKGALATADRTQQVEDLFLFLQSLCGMSEIRHDVLDRLLHSVEVPEGRIDLDHLVGEDA
jgi:hypothetical protein